MFDAKDVKACLNQNLETVCHHLLPNGKKRGQEWRVGSLHGEAGDSLAVQLTGSKKGVWSDFATGEKGDVLTLWQKVKGLSFVEALNDAGQFLNLSPHKAPFSQPAPATPVQPLSITNLSGEALHYLTNQRLLSEKSLKAYGIGGKESIEFAYHDQNGRLTSVKHLKLARENGRKQMWVKPNNNQPILFGWQALPKTEKELTICEGELDAISLYEYGRPALSLPFGAGGGAKQQWIENEWSNLEQFETLYIALDHDEAGEKTIPELIDRLGVERCRVVQCPKKDWNTCLVEGVSVQEIEKAFLEAKNFESG